MQRAVALYTIAAVCTLCSSAAYGQEGASTVLTESTFERLTQAAGGQTAGIWCEEANLQWERLTASQQSKGSPVSFGQVEATDLGSAKLFQRFGLEELPSYVLFRDRKMFRYGGDGSEEDLVRFMIDEYREVHAEDVPPPPSLLSDLREKLLDFMDEHWTPGNKKKAFYAGVILLPVLPWAIPLVVWLRQRSNRPTGPKTRRD